MCINSSLGRSALCNCLIPSISARLISHLAILSYCRDPDGYYIEICNCDETLTKYSLGEKDELPGYEESIRPISFRTASMIMNLVQRWIEKLEIETSNMEDVFEKVNDTDGTIQQVADLLGYKHTTGIDESILQTLKDRHSIYGDIWQNEEESDIEDILRAAGNGEKYRTYTNVH